MRPLHSLLITGAISAGLWSIPVSHAADPVQTEQKQEPLRVEQLSEHGLTDKQLITTLKQHADTVRRVRLNRAKLSTAGWNQLSSFRNAQAITIVGGENLTDATLAFPQRLNKLSYLSLSYCDRVTGEFLSKPGVWKQLDAFSISSSKFDGRYLQHFGGGKLRSLSIRNPLLRPSHLDALGVLENLEELTLIGSPKLFGVDLSRFPNLKQLIIRNCGIRSQGLRGLKRHKHLELLMLTKCEHLRRVNLSGATSLQSVDFSNTQVGDETTSQFAGLQNLQAITLTKCPQVTTVDVAGLVKLQKLDVTGTSLRADGLQNINAASALTRIDAANLGSLDDAVLKEIARLPKLKTLDVSGTWFSKDSRRLLTTMKTDGKVTVYSTND